MESKGKAKFPHYVPSFFPPTYSVMAALYRHPIYTRLFSQEQYVDVEGYDHNLEVNTYFNLNPRRDTIFLPGRGNPILIFIDGACPKAGYPDARGGYGVYWGPVSKYNVCKQLKPNQPQNTQRADLTAAIVGLNQIEYYRNESGDKRTFYVLVTDSAYLVNTITWDVYKWRENGYTTTRGTEVVNKDLFEVLDYKLHAMKNGRQQIEVLFWKVDRFYNQDADRLARIAAYMK